MRQVAARTLVVLLALVLAGCGGWRLRGYADALAGIADLQPVALRGDLDNATGRALRDELDSRGLRLDTGAQTLLLEGVASRRQAASFDADAEVAEFELEELLTLTIVGQDGSLLFGPDRMAVERVYRYDPDEVVGSAEEQEQLQREMRQELARQVLQALSAVQRRAAQAQADAEAANAAQPAVP